MPHRPFHMFISTVMNTSNDRYEHGERSMRADALLFSLIIKGITKKKYYLYT